MAEVTRFKDLQEAQKKLDQVLQAESMKRAASEQKIQEQIAGIDQKYEHVTHTLAEIKLQLLNLGKDTGSGGSILGGYGFTPGSGKSPTGNFVHSPLPRLDFPRFDGTNPRAWMLKCNSYFKLMPSVPDAQKMNLATMHFDGKALTWFQNLNMGDIGISWNQFLEVVSARFDDLKVSSIIVEFNKLKQTSTYADYVERFEELRGCMVLDDCSKYSEEYFIASFISGLSEELQSFINMFHPTTLEHTIELGKQQIHTLNAISKRLCLDVKPFQNQSLPYGRAEQPSPQSQPSPQGSAKIGNTIISKPPTKLLTAAEMAARRNKGLCYNCDDPYFVGHRCTQRVNYILMTEDEELLDDQKLAELELQEVETNMVQHIEEVHISLHSMTSVNGLTTMRMVGEVGNHELHILLDTGSTLSFLQEGTATRLGCAISDVNPLLVRVANGHKLISTKEATNFKWTVQGHEFQFSPRLLNIGGGDMILGGDWLRVCSPIELDYATMIFTVSLHGKRIKIQALTTALDYKGGTGIVLTSLLHEEFTDFSDFNASLLHGCVGDDIVPVGDSAAVDVAGGYRITPLYAPRIRAVTWGDGWVFPRFLQWIRSKLSFALQVIAAPTCCKSTFFDPCGQGSFEAGGIVMTHIKKRGEGNDAGEGKKEELWRMVDLGKSFGEEMIWETSGAGGFGIGPSVLGFGYN